MMETAILTMIGVGCGVVLGFWLGRVSAKYYMGQTEGGGQNSMADETGVSGEGGGQQQRQKRVTTLEDNMGKERCNRLWYDRRKMSEAGVSIIGSPIFGVVTDCAEGKRPEVIIYPMEEKLYAPAEGKVIRLLPLGNEMLFRTEEGTVLRMMVAPDADDLQSDYFRVKVIQNEVVSKGKLLMEFDKGALEAEGVECNVSVRIEEVGMGEKVLGIADGRVKIGEAIFEISQI